MEQIRIRSCIPQDVTVITNEFLDRFLPEANGEFLKIYLYLLRNCGRTEVAFSLSSIADQLNCTETDVSRALRYWDKEKVIHLGTTAEGAIVSLELLAYTSKAPATVQEAPAATVEETPSIEKSTDITAARMSELGESEEIRELFFVAQQYLGRPLTRSEMQRICFFYDGLHFSTDLIDYLIDYCVSRGKSSFHYMEKVAMSWKEQGISSVHEARVQAESYHREYYDILKALGVNNHHPVDAEIKLMKKWLEKYAFPMDIIGEACTRTLMGTGKPTLSYADSILSRWYASGVKTMADIEVLDAEHATKVEQQAEKKPAKTQKKQAGSFTDFEQRSYDYSALESQLLNQ